MQKSYPNQLAEWVERRASSKKELNHVAFLAIRDDVQAAIDVGFQPKTIWKNMRESGRIVFGYDTFLQYVRRYTNWVRPSSANTHSVKPLRAATKQVVAVSKPEGSQTKGASAIPGFTFNSAPRKEDLL